MFEFLRNLGKSAEDKQQELLSAYLDGDLTSVDQQRLEAQLVADDTLQTELDHLRFLKQQMGSMPRRRVPRSFSLDPSVYGRPQPQQSSTLYPVLRGATALTALVFVILLGLNLVQGGLGSADIVPADTLTLAEPSGQESLAIESDVVVEESAVEQSEEAVAVPAMDQPLLSEETQVVEGEMLEAPALAPIAEESLDLPEGSVEGASGDAAPRDAQAIAPILAETMPDEAEATPLVLGSEDTVAGAVTAAGAVENDNNRAAAEQKTKPQSLFQPLVIGLGIALLVLLLLTLIARSRQPL